MRGAAVWSGRKEGAKEKREMPLLATPVFFRRKGASFPKVLE